MLNLAYSGLAQLCTEIRKLLKINFYIQGWCNQKMKLMIDNLIVQPISLTWKDFASIREGSEHSNFLIRILYVSLCLLEPSNLCIQYHHIRPPGQTRPDQTKPDQTRTEQTRPDQNRPEQTRTDQNRPEQNTNQSKNIRTNQVWMLGSKKTTLWAIG